MSSGRAGTAARPRPKNASAVQEHIAGTGAEPARRCPCGGPDGHGLITCLTDGHPGVSGGGVLNQRDDLVGIPIGRMRGDFRFSFILPLRAEMFRTLPS